MQMIIKYLIKLSHMKTQLTGSFLKYGDSQAVAEDLNLNLLKEMINFVVGHQMVF